MTLNRFLLVCLAAIALAWVGFYVLDIRERAADQAFYERKVAPALKSVDAYDKDALDQWLGRMSRRQENAMIRLDLFAGGAGLFFVWIVIGIVRGEIFWKLRNAADRVADPNAGLAIGDLRRIGGPFVARSTAGERLRVVEVDAVAETIVFRGFTFVRSFVGNRPSAQMVLRFEDILGGRIRVNHELYRQYSLNLRTTAGKVMITDAVKPFHELAAILLDAAEANRAQPDRYAAALAREPRNKTPWYGWLILAGGLVGVAGFATLLWNLLGK